MKPYIDVGEVLGRNVYLDDVRIVFLGRHQTENGNGHYALAFRSEKGTDAYLRLSQEALAALGLLIDEALRDTPKASSTPESWTEDFPHKTVWRLVRTRSEGEVVENGE